MRKFVNPKESAKNGWKLFQELWELIMKYREQPKEMNAKACLKKVESQLDKYYLKECRHSILE